MLTCQWQASVLELSSLTTVDRAYQRVKARGQSHATHSLNVVSTTFVDEINALMEEVSDLGNAFWHGLVLIDSS